MIHFKECKEIIGQVFLHRVNKLTAPPRITRLILPRHTDLQRVTLRQPLILGRMPIIELRDRPEPRLDVLRIDQDADLPGLTHVELLQIATRRVSARHHRRRRLAELLQPRRCHHIVPNPERLG
jgi:hypothetical protein